MRVEPAARLGKSRESMVILNHFQMMAAFAAAVSLGFAFLSRHSMGDRIRYWVWAFLAFLVVAIGIGWLMYPFSH